MCSALVDISPQDWADAIHDAGAPAPRCIGFIDGTFRPHTRPVRGQRQCYSGYKKLHGIKFQSVVGANGLIVDFYGSIVGRRGDGYLLRRSGFLARMAALVAAEGAAFYVYGDPAYALSQYILRGFKGAMSPAQQQFSTEMSRVREVVEWGFELIIRDWTYLDYRKNLQIHKQARRPCPKPCALCCRVHSVCLAAHRSPLLCRGALDEHEDVHHCSPHLRLLWQPDLPRPYASI